MKKKIYINASSLRDAGCKRCLRYRICNSFTAEGKPEGLELISDKLPMFWGSCFHVFLQNYYTNGDLNTAIHKAQEKFDKKGIEPDERYSIDSLERVGMRYAFEYKGDNLKVLAVADGGTFVEKLFCMPFYEDAEYIVFLFGKMDLIALYYGSVTIFDHKTTANAYPDNYLKEYLLNQQVFFYKYVCWRYARAYPETAGFLENAQFVINGIFLSKKEPVFQRRDYHLNEADMIEFERLLSNYVKSFLTYLRTTPEDREGLVTTSCVNRRYGKCDFWQLCEDKSDEDMLAALEGVSYRRRVYDTSIHEEE